MHANGKKGILMPEIRDIYTEQGQMTGRTFVKGEPLGPGEYFLHTIILIMGRGGQYLLQQRALTARHYPGKWDVTGGGVIHGETSRAAAVREAYEELGLEIDPEALVYGGRIAQSSAYWLDMYGVRLDITDEDCRISAREVNGVRMEPFEAFEEIVSYNKDAEYMALQRRTHELLLNQ